MRAKEKLEFNRKEFDHYEFVRKSIYDLYPLRTDKQKTKDYFGSPAKYPFAFTQQVVAQLPDISYLTSAQQPVAQIGNLPQKELLQMVSWSHHCILMDKDPDIPERYWYYRDNGGYQ